MAYGLSRRFCGAPADVAELVDALVSGTSGSNVVGVQVSPSASIFIKSLINPEGLYLQGLYLLVAMNLWCLIEE